MIIESIAFIILICSLGGISLILIRKNSVLISLPQNGSTGIKKHRIILDAESKIKNILISVEKQIYLHKILSWVKVITLKVETKVDGMLHSIRRKAQQVDKEIKNKK